MNRQNAALTLVYCWENGFQVPLIIQTELVPRRYGFRKGCRSGNAAVFIASGVPGPQRPLPQSPRRARSGHGVRRQPGQELTAAQGGRRAWGPSEGTGLAVAAVVAGVTVTGCGLQGRPGNTTPEGGSRMRPLSPEETFFQLRLQKLWEISLRLLTPSTYMNSVWRLNRGNLNVMFHIMVGFQTLFLFK